MNPTLNKLNFLRALGKISVGNWSPLQKIN